MSNMLYTRFTKLIIDYFLSCNKNIPRRSDFEMHIEGDDSPITKLSNTVKGTYIFIMEIPDTMINDAFKKSARYKYYKAKKVETDYEANVPKMFKKDVLPEKTRSLTIAEESYSDATRHSSCSDTSEESGNETDDADDLDMDLTDDEPKGDDDVAEFREFMYNKSTETPKSTYFNLTITSSYLDFN
ncbi:hypothetical protein Tco_0922555 [Tanacetum coccineum]|uniref:Uncharacterized protein n=1 Tax=Tanacetum coccineum TaxID=301880 RepID=A0ABQ5CYH3_9ASTR